jgi:hypothetical protein
MKIQELFAAVALLAPAAQARAGVLTVNDAVQGAKTIVCEFPQDADRAAAVDFVRRVRDKFYPGAEIIEAGPSLGEEVKARLKAGFVLYSVPREGPRLLDQTLPGFDARLSSGEASLMGSSVRDPWQAIFAGENPYGPKPCAVYAASANSGIVGINSRFHGPKSFYLFSGSASASGLYDDKFAPVLQKIRLGDALLDSVDFFASLERIHPDLLANLSPESYLDLRERIPGELASAVLPDGSIERRDLIFVLSGAAAAFKDGHTSIRFWEKDNEPEGSFPPFLLKRQGMRVLLSAAEQKDLEGRELTAVDGVPIMDFLAPILSRQSAETDSLRLTRFIKEQGSWWWLSGKFEKTGKFQAALRGEDGKGELRTLETIPAHRFRRLFAVRPQKENTRLEFLDDGKIAYFRYPAFEKTQAEEAKVRAIFKDIRKSGARELIVDIRGNGGGNSSMGDLILSHLCSGRFRQFSAIKTRISRDLLDQSRREGWRHFLKYGSLEGLTVTNKEGWEEPEKPEAFFDGRAWLLVDELTFSSGVGFAAAFRDYVHGEIVGAETGGVPTCFGDVMIKSLPRSGLSYGVSYKHFVNGEPRPGDDKHGVLPDIPADEARLAPFSREKDPVLALAMDRVRRSREGSAR